MKLLYDKTPVKDRRGTAMAKGFKTITISIEVYDKLREYYEKHADELRFKRALAVTENRRRIRWLTLLPSDSEVSLHGNCHRTSCLLVFGLTK